MRRRVSPYIGALTLVLVAGCAKPLQIGILGDRSVTPQQIDQLVAEEEYGEALDLLNSVPETHPQYVLLHAKLKDVQKRAADYEKTVLDTMWKKADEGNWSGALDEVNAGLDKLPSSLVLQRGREELRRKRAQRIDYLETELLIAKGKWLVEDAPLREELMGVESGNLFTKWKMSRRQGEVQETAEKLLQCGRRAQNEKTLEQAKTCLTLAERLDSSETMKAAVSATRQEIAKHEKQALAKQANQAMNRGQLGRSRDIVSRLAKIDPDNRQVRQLQRRLTSLKKQAQQEKIQHDYNRLMSQAREAIDKGELQKAQEILPQLAQIDPDNPEVRQLQRRLNEAVSATVDKLLKRGSMLYRREKVELAKRVWEEVLQLDPSNSQAKAGVKRAERVLGRLRELKEQERPAQESYP